VESGRQVAHATGERREQTTIMLARLIRTAEEREKDERARDQRPAEHLEPDRHNWVILPNEACELVDRGIVAVRVGPAIRSDTQLRSLHDVICPQRNGPEYLDGGNGYQAEVPAAAGTMGRRHYLLELTSALVERINGYDWNR
jgi:hypothetical protein